MWRNTCFASFVDWLRVHNAAAVAEAVLTGHGTAVHAPVHAEQVLCATMRAFDFAACAESADAIRHATLHVAFICMSGFQTLPHHSPSARVICSPCA